MANAVGVASPPLSDDFLLEREVDEVLDLAFTSETVAASYSGAPSASTEHAEQLAELKVQARQRREEQDREIAEFREETAREVRIQHDRAAKAESRAAELSLEVSELSLRLSRERARAEDAEREAAGLREEVAAMRNCTRHLESLAVRQRRRIRSLRSARGAPPAETAEFRKQLLRRVTKLLATAERTNQAAARLAPPYGDYADECPGPVDPTKLTVSISPDPAPVGHPCSLVVVTRNSRGQPCRGAAADEFEVTPVGGATLLSPMAGSRTCFSAVILPIGQDAGRQGATVTFRGQAKTATTYVVVDTAPVDPARTTLMLAPNPCPVGDVAVATILVKNSRELACAGSRARDFVVLQPAGLGEAMPVPGVPSQFTLAVPTTQPGIMQVKLSHAGTVRTASLEVVPRGVGAAPVSAVRTVLACSPDPARVGEEVEVTAIVRDAGGAPCGGVETQDLHGLKPVGSGVDELRPLERLSPSCFRTTFRARRPGSAGVTLRYQGLPLYTTTTVEDGVAAVDPQNVSIALASAGTASQPTGVPVAVRVTARDRCRAQCAFDEHCEEDWTLRPSAGSDVAVVTPLKRRGCSVLLGEVIARSAGEFRVELLHQGHRACSVTFVAEEPKPFHPQSTELRAVVDNPWVETVDGADPLKLTTLDTATLTVRFRSQGGGPARAPEPSQVSIAAAAPGSCQVTPPTRAAFDKLEVQVYGFVVLGACPLKISVGGHLLSKVVEVVPPGGPADESKTRVMCRPETCCVGDRVVASIGFFDETGCPARFASTEFSSLDVESIGAVSGLTRIDPAGARGERELSHQDLAFSCDAPGECGVVLRHGTASARAVCVVGHHDSHSSGPVHLPATDVSLTPDPARPGQTVNCVITVRDAVGVPLEGVPTPQLHIVLRPLSNTGHVRPAVRPVPGCTSTWMAAFTAGPEAGVTGVRVEVSEAAGEGRESHAIHALASVDDNPLTRLDDAVMDVIESNNKLLEDVDWSGPVGEAAAAAGAGAAAAAVEPEQTERGGPAFEKRSTPYYGVEVTEGGFQRGSDGTVSRFDYQGVKVVSAAGPAGVAGIQEGDVITHVCGQPTSSLIEFRRALRARGRVGEPITVALRRGGSGEVKQVSVTAESRPVGAPMARYRRRFSVTSPQRSGSPDVPDTSTDTRRGSAVSSPRRRSSSRSAEARRRR